MLYLVLADGAIKEVPGATHAKLSEHEEALICYDTEGREVARYAKLSVVMFRKTPFPTRKTGDGEARRRWDNG